MRDRRFVARHRGGPLDRESHVFLVRWAAACAERVIHFFSQCSDDTRPPEALATAGKWADGDIKTGVAIKASAAAHAAAREVVHAAAIAAARAAGQAVATAHFADHSMEALIYSLKALEASGCSSNEEFDLQIMKLPEHLRDPIVSGVSIRIARYNIR